MIYTDEQLSAKIKDMIIKFEDEVVEFKEARTSYSFKDIGKYFSALGNEANIRGIPTTWNGAAYAREDENTCPLPMDKMDLFQ